MWIPQNFGGGFIFFLLNHFIHMKWANFTYFTMQMFCKNVLFENLYILFPCWFWFWFSRLVSPMCYWSAESGPLLSYSWHRCFIRMLYQLFSSLVQIIFIILKFSSYLSLLSIQRCWASSNAYFFIHCSDHFVFVPYFINIEYYIDFHFLCYINFPSLISFPIAHDMYSFEILTIFGLLIFCECLHIHEPFSFLWYRCFGIRVI